MCSASLGTVSMPGPCYSASGQWGSCQGELFFLLLPKAVKVAKPVPRCDRRCAGRVQEMCANG